MDTLAILYALNATSLLLHELESAYVKEWEMLKLPGKITGFILLHIPIIMILFWGAIEIGRHSIFGRGIAIAAGVGGTIPFLVHKLFVRKNGYFESPISNWIIYSNLVLGLLTVFTAAYTIYN